MIDCKCFYREDDHCFLGHPGNQATCTSHKEPAKIDKPPGDPQAWLKKNFPAFSH